jgi:galactokinase/CTP:molybdopterin cytidylyltransferase MocA
MILSDLKLTLSELVRVPNSEIQVQSQRLLALCNLFFERYGDGPINVLRAPARINILGEHIDYVSYLPTSSLTFGSHERDAVMLYRQSSERRVRSASTSPNYPQSSFSIVEPSLHFRQSAFESDWLSFLDNNRSEPHWQNYIKGAVTLAQAKFGNRIVNGFDFALDSTIPAGGGASSSSALVVLGGAAIREVNEISFTLEGLAKDSALAEWFIGTRGGSMDHTTICLAEDSSAVLISYATAETRRMFLPARPFQWITFFSRPADKGREVMIEYNERAAVSRLLIPAIIKSWRTTHPDRYRQWSDALESLSSGSLCGLDCAEELLLNIPETITVDEISRRHPDTLYDLERSFPALLGEASRWPLKVRNRALHHVREVKRVGLAARTLDLLSEAANVDEMPAMRLIGNLLDDSHQSLRDLYEVSTDEVEQLVQIVRSNPNVLGARLMGGGFGGNVLALTTEEHSEQLIQQVQREFYEPQSRNGVREGAVMVSTPGKGLAHVSLEDIYRDGIIQINSLGSDAAEHRRDIQQLIDSLAIETNSQEIWPIVVAAGKGTRAISSGLDVPKPVAIVRQKPSIVHVLQNLRAGLGITRPPVIIVSPETEHWVRKAVEGENVLFAVQPESLGTGDAVLNTHSLLANFEGEALVIWSTQPVIQPKTFQRTAKLGVLFGEYSMIVPTAIRHRPYAPLHRDNHGAVTSATETHIEAARVVDLGETNIGMFLLNNQTMFEVLLDLRHRYWDEPANRYNRPGSELGFPNEVINILGPRRAGVFASPIADAREEQGIKQLSDVAKCERFISELLEET